MRPSDALAYRRILLEDCDSSSSWDPDEELPDQSNNVLTALEDIRTTLPISDVYYVSADMTAVAIAASRTMPEQPLRLGDLPSENGFMVWDAPIGWFSFRDGRTPVVGITWSLGHHTETPFWGDDMFSDHGCTVVFYNEHDPAHKARWARMHEPADGDDPPTGFFTGSSLNIYLFVDLWDGGAGSHRLMPLGTIEWFIGSPPQDYADETQGEIAKALLATWTLMGQSLTVTAPGHVDRPERRRNARLELPAEVIIVRLRRRSTVTDDGEEGHPVEWSHQWLVGGHWRNQWLPSRQTHRLQWIAPYVKGPTGLPLVVKERITAWIR